MRFYDSKMNIKSIFINTLLFSTLLFTSSCALESNQDVDTPTLVNGKDIVIPKGAPTLSTYKMIVEGKAEVMSSATNIPPLFSTSSYPFIVFDSIKGIEIIKKAGTNAHYEFDSMLTGGNFHLLAFNKEDEAPTNLNISDSDYILGFQKGGTPDKLFRTIYSDVKSCDIYLDDINSLKDKLLSMDNEYRVDRKVIDYAVVAEPAATIIKSQLIKKGLKVSDINLQGEYKKKFSASRNKDFIPQAGLFVRKDIKDNFPTYYKEIKTKISDSRKDVLSNTVSVKESIESKFSSAEEQNLNFGFNTKIITMVQGEKGEKNGFGIVPNDIHFSLNDIDIFNSSLINQ